MDNKPQPWQLQPHCWGRRQVVELSGLPVQDPAKKIPNAVRSCRLAAFRLVGHRLRQPDKEEEAIAVLI